MYINVCLHILILLDCMPMFVVFPFLWIRINCFSRIAMPVSSRKSQRLPGLDWGWFEDWLNPMSRQF